MIFLIQPQQIGDKLLPMTKEEFNYLTKSPKNRIRNTDMATIRKLK